MPKPRKPDAAEKKPTTGEKIMCDFYGMSIEELRTGESQSAWSAKSTARRIDAAIKRAVKEAFHPSLDASREYRLAERNRVAAKYNVKL